MRRHALFGLTVGSALIFAGPAVAAVTPSAASSANAAQSTAATADTTTLAPERITIKCSAKTKVRGEGLTAFWVTVCLENNENRKRVRVITTASNASPSPRGLLLTNYVSFKEKNVGYCGWTKVPGDTMCASAWIGYDKRDRAKSAFALVRVKGNSPGVRVGVG
jgi:hypothetical protein